MAVAEIIGLELVKPENRLKVLPRAYGLEAGMKYEQTVFNAMSALCEGYSGGYYDYYLLPRGAVLFVLRSEKSSMFSSPNGWSGTLTPVAAGYAICCMSLSLLAFDYHDKPAGDVFTEHFHELREAALGHTEAGAIMAFLD